MVDLEINFSGVSVVSLALHILTIDEYTFAHVTRCYLEIHKSRALCYRLPAGLDRRVSWCVLKSAFQRRPKGQILQWLPGRTRILAVLNLEIENSGCMSQLLGRFLE